MNDGAGGTVFSEVNSSNDAAVRDQPVLSTLAITAFASANADVGKDF